MDCDDKCGCAVPCPGSANCRCASGVRSGEQQREHKTCRCGEHCGCSPCECGQEGAPSGLENRRATCSCGPTCTCDSCGSTTA